MAAMAAQANADVSLHHEAKISSVAYARACTTVAMAAQANGHAVMSQDDHKTLWRCQLWRTHGSVPPQGPQCALAYGCESGMHASFTQQP